MILKSMIARLALSFGEFEREDIRPDDEVGRT